MRTVQDIYDMYRIPSQLQLHQLRVASVARLAAEHLQEPCDVETVTIAGLFHDMGNILKVQFDVFPEFWEPEGVEYWRAVKADFVRTYGTDEHAATVAIAHEIGLPSAFIEALDSIGFGKVAEVLTSHPVEHQCVEYGDLRVGPHGILPLIERIEDGRRRYRDRMYAAGKDPEAHFDALRADAVALETKLFAGSSIEPADIDDAAVEGMLGG